jgi:hypothetical protein
MTKDEIVALIERLRDLAVEANDGGDPALAEQLRSYADDTEADLRSGKLPP